MLEDARSNVFNQNNDDDEEVKELEEKILAEGITRIRYWILKRILAINPKMNRNNPRLLLPNEFYPSNKVLHNIFHINLNTYN